MENKLFNNQKDWDKAVLTNNSASFLQSWEWGNFQIMTGKQIFRLNIREQPVQGFEHPLVGSWKYLYIPRLQLAESGWQELINYLKSKKYIFLRIEPLEKISQVFRHQFQVRNRQPQQTLVLDLTRTEEQLLAKMHTKTRYNINVAKRHDLEIRQEKDIEVFWQLNLETINRDRFKSHTRDYYEKMLSLPISYQLTAYYQNKPIASNILVAFGDTITYLHGTSASDFRNLMAPYLLQWAGIKLGKELHCQYYDFWGIASRVTEGEKKPFSCFHNYCWEVNHPWSGVTRFKVGFGGETKEYPSAVDIIFRPIIYQIYKLARNIKGLK